MNEKYITVNTVNKTFGKYVEIQDIYIGLPSLILFIILFTIPATRILSLILLSTVLFMLIPISLSKKNRMYKIIFMLLKYMFKCKNFIWIKKDVKFE